VLCFVLYFVYAYKRILSNIRKDLIIKKTYISIFIVEAMSILCMIYWFGLKSVNWHQMESKY